MGGVEGGKPFLEPKRNHLPFQRVMMSQFTTVNFVVYHANNQVKFMTIYM